MESLHDEDKYDWYLSYNPLFEGFTVTLMDIASGRKKVFQFTESHVEENICAHFESLTDDQCKDLLKGAK